MAPTNSQMPTDAPLLRVLADFETQGYASQFVSRSGGAIWCVDGDHRFSAASGVVEEQRRLEGASDPSDMMIVFSLHCPICDAAGTLLLRYGPEAGSEDADVLAALPAPPTATGTSSTDAAP